MATMISTVEQLKQFVDTWRYRPGTQFSVVPEIDWMATRHRSRNVYHEFGPVGIHVRVRIINADDWSRTDHLQAVHPLVLPIEESRLLMGIREFLGSLELHERDEFFRVDGVKIWDPHAPTPPLQPLSPEAREALLRGEWKDP